MRPGAEKRARSIIPLVVVRLRGGMALARALRWVLSDNQFAGWNRHLDDQKAGAFRGVPTWFVNTRPTVRNLPGPLGPAAEAGVKQILISTVFARGASSTT
jgi:hypothetical protein